MGCNCGGRKSRKGNPVRYELTLPGGEVKVFASQVEAKVARRKAGGGTIRVIET